MKIQILNLARGVHHYDFTESCESLDLLDKSIFANEVFVRVSLEKNRDNLILDANFRTLAHFTCDRCLDPFVRVLEDSLSLIYSYNEDVLGLDDENVRWISHDTQEIDITADVRDMVLLSLPIKALCAEECLGLCAGCGANLNREPCTCPPQETDPRWEPLRKVVHTG